MEDGKKIPFAQAIQLDSTLLEIPRDRHWVEPTLTFLGKRCRQNGMRQDLMQVRLSLACREALEQSLRRSPPSKSPLRVELRFEPRSCVLTIRDDRPWVEPTRLADSTERLANPDRRRLNLIRTLVDDFELTEQGLALQLRVRRQEAEPLRPSVLPFVNPVEVFPLQFDGCIDYDMAYQAVFRDVTEAGITLLQQNVVIPKKACIGVYSGGRLFFLPVQLRKESELKPGLKEAAFAYAADSLKDKLPRPRLDAPFEEAQVVTSVDAIVADVGKQSPAQHRRAHERVLLSDRSVRLREAPEGSPVFARDFSVGGLALMTTFPLEVGQVCHVEFTTAGHDVAALPMRIVRCLPLVDDFYDVGGEFLDASASSSASAKNSNG